MSKLYNILNNLADRTLQHDNDIITLDTNAKSTAQAKAEYHVGLYRDADGDLCEE